MAIKIRTDRKIVIASKTEQNARDMMLQYGVLAEAGDYPAFDDLVVVCKNGDDIANNALELPPETKWTVGWPMPSGDVLDRLTALFGPARLLGQALEAESADVAINPKAFNRAPRTKD